MVFTEPQHGTVYYLENFWVAASNHCYTNNSTIICDNLKYSTAWVTNNLLHKNHWKIIIWNENLFVVLHLNEYLYLLKELYLYFFKEFSAWPAFTCRKTPMETQEQCVKYADS